MELNNKINAFKLLGEFLGQFGPESVVPSQNSLNQKYFHQFEELISNQQIYNQWFTREMIRHSLFSWSLALQSDKLIHWLSAYKDIDKLPEKTIGVVMAGNVPMVGFHDMLCVLACGYKLVAKTSEKDNQLLSFVGELLAEIDPWFTGKITFTNNQLSGFDGIIATGSNNTLRYFDYYFNKYPNLIRGNRNSAALLHGDETFAELEKLCDDIFLYFGLGCRSVSKIYVPVNYKFDNFFKAAEKYQWLINHKKYGNNYDYNKALFLINKVNYLDNGFVLLTENESLSSPVSVLHYEQYTKPEDILLKIYQAQNQMQVLVSQKPVNGHSVQFGKAQFPELWEYADNKDTIDFLINIK